MPPVTRKEASRQQEQEAAEHEEGDITPKGDNGSVSGVSNADEPITCGSQPTQSSAFQAPSEQFLSTLMETITRAQAEANRNLLSALFTSNFSTSSPSAPAPSTYVPASAPRTSITSGAPAPAGTACGNFSKCTVRFSGSSHDGEVLEAFLDSVEIFKECAAVSDDHALRGLPMLLEGEAAIWWRGVKASVISWPDALARLRATYGVTQPAHKIFRQIFAAEQRDDERAEVFLCRIRALLAKLPYVLPESAQIDMCYGLLHRRVKKRVSRECIISLDKLLCDARIAEDAVRESKEVTTNPQRNSVLRLWESGRGPIEV
ncbi:Retrovirus-related Pol polyprotein from transposon 17.6 [Operophtera brumata]|uniref:Retrovirus-related Pol polyprotein from transposon 17.6 n=1 Tax=Operophtera brumata TaxID=104452 RepID=A0A0L7LDZ7_OPEBR|nr:Retrovirus-related Pol polyprotein from transposon 17.6 [Operophtera brumata]